MALFSGRRRNPTVSWAAIGALLLFGAVHAVSVIGGPRLAYVWALMPGELTAALRTIPSDPGNLAAWASVATVWTSVLVHANVMHLAFNGVYLYFFGTLLMQLAGERAVIAAMFVTSVTSAAGFVLWQGGESAAYMIGASGAISGVAGLFVLLSLRWDDAPQVYAWPLARPVVPITAGLLAIASIALDVYGLKVGGAGATALEAHVGGFAGGLLLGAVVTSFLPTRAHYQRSRIGRGT